MSVLLFSNKTTSFFYNVLQNIFDIFCTFFYFTLFNCHKNIHTLLNIYAKEVLGSRYCLYTWHNTKTPSIILDSFDTSDILPSYIIHKIWCMFLVMNHTNTWMKLNNVWCFFMYIFDQVQNKYSILTYRWL